MCGACSRSSGWKIATFKYKRSTRSTPPQLRLENRNFQVQTQHAERAPAAPGGKSQFLSTDIVCGACSRSSGWKIATFKYRRSTRSTPPQLRRIATFKYKRSTRSTPPQLQLHKALAQSNLHRPTCTEHMRKALARSNWRRALAQSNLLRALAQSNLHRAGAEQLAQTNLRRAHAQSACAEQLAQSAQSNLLRALAQSNLHRALARSSLQRATCAQQPGTMQLAQTTFVRNRAAQFERKVG